VTRIGWDEWRACYDESSFADQRGFYNDVYREFPEQSRYSTRRLQALLDWMPAGPVSVVELGGWQGAFAAEMLEAQPRISRWANYEISSDAVEASVCDDGRYVGVALNRWYWDDRHRADVFVASHVIEHLRLEQVEAAIRATDCRYLYLQAPLGDGPTDWRGYRGSHILECGWGGVTAAAHTEGFVEIRDLRAPNVRCYEAAA
jgi:hypothetical protein